jgi:hypothetical protein
VRISIAGGIFGKCQSVSPRSNSTVVIAMQASTPSIAPAQASSHLLGSTPVDPYEGGGTNIFAAFIAQLLAGNRLAVTPQNGASGAGREPMA